MPNNAPFSGLQPASLWRHFEAITHIPRPSKQEEKMVAYVQEWAKGRGYAIKRDQTGNVCVTVPASPGREKAPTVVLQSHLDMVCERNADSPYDAEQGRIHAVRQGEWIIAEGTTLGADNGIGVAAMLSVGETEEFRHGPLELLFTLDEETGLTGAKNLDAKLLQGRTLINLDSEDDGVLCVGCAGGTDTIFRLTLARSAIPAGWQGLGIAVTGLQGGHSGTDIDKNRLNAIRAMTRIVQEVAKQTPLMLRGMSGGNKRNAIPRECNVLLCCPASSVQQVRHTVEQVREALAKQYRGLDDGLKVTVIDQAVDASQTAFSSEQTNRLLDLLRAIPSGVVAMSQDIKGLVETSSNLSVITASGNQVEVICSSRSSVPGAMRDILDTLHALARLSGATLDEKDGYPGWKPEMSSKVLAVTKQAYRNLFGSDPEVTAVHAGLECGLIGEQIPGMDMVSFGPQINGPHAPGERVHVPSVAKFWKLLGAVLDDISK